MIKRDIARTFPDHSFFKDKDGIGQGTLFNVIKVKLDGHYQYILPSMKNPFRPVVEQVM